MYVQSEPEDSVTTSASAVGIAAVGGTAIGIAGIGVDTRRTLPRLSKSDRKIGHRRVDNDGQVTYKKVTVSNVLSSVDKM